MENVNNASSKNLQIPSRNQGQTEKTGSFFNDILTSSQSQLSLSGKYVRNLNVDKAGNFNKAYNFVKNDPKTKVDEGNTFNDIHKRDTERLDKSDRPDKYENRSSHNVKNDSSNDALKKISNEAAESEETENENHIDNTGAVSEDKPLKTIDKPSSEPETDSIDSQNPMQGVISEQQIKEMAILIIDQLNKIKSGIQDSDQLIAGNEGEFIDIAKGEIINILKDKSLDPNIILPKLQEYISQITSANENTLTNPAGSVEGMDEQILNSILKSLIQDKGIQSNEKSSVKSEINNIVDEEILIIPESTAKPADLSGKALQNQLQLLKNDTDETLFSGEKSYIKDLIVSDKKISEQLMDFNSAKTLVQSSSSTAAPQPFISRNASFLQMVSKITEEIRLSVDNNKTQMIIKLEPETLGRLTVKVSSENGIMNASFYAENDKAKAMIENHMAELRSSLEKQGIQIQNLTVTVDQNQQELTRHKNIMEAKSYSKNKGIAIELLDEKEIAAPINPYFSQDLFNDLI